MGTEPPTIQLTGRRSATEPRGVWEEPGLRRAIDASVAGLRDFAHMHGPIVLVLVGGSNFLLSGFIEKVMYVTYRQVVVLFRSMSLSM